MRGLGPGGPRPTEAREKGEGEGETMAHLTPAQAVLAPAQAKRNIPWKRRVVAFGLWLIIVITIPTVVTLMIHEHVFDLQARNDLNIDGNQGDNVFAGNPWIIAPMLGMLAVWCTSFTHLLLFRVDSISFWSVVGSVLVGQVAIIILWSPAALPSAAGPPIPAPPTAPRPPVGPLCEWLAQPVPGGVCGTESGYFVSPPWKVAQLARNQSAEGIAPSCTLQQLETLASMSDPRAAVISSLSHLESISDLSQMFMRLRDGISALSVRVPNFNMEECSNQVMQLACNFALPRCSKSGCSPLPVCPTICDGTLSKCAQVLIPGFIQDILPGGVLRFAAISLMGDARTVALFDALIIATTMRNCASFDEKRPSSMERGCSPRSFVSSNNMPAFIDSQLTLNNASNNATHAFAWGEFQGHVYQLYMNRMTWSQAQRFARSRTYRGIPGSLAIINSTAENEFITKLTLLHVLSSSTWIGGSDSSNEGIWRWNDGTQFWNGGASGSQPSNDIYVNWRIGEPKDVSAGVDDCLAIRRSGFWQASPCSSEYFVIIEFPVKALANTTSGEIMHTDYFDVYAPRNSPCSTFASVDASASLYAEQFIPNNNPNSSWSCDVDAYSAFERGDAVAALQEPYQLLVRERQSRVDFARTVESVRVSVLVLIICAIVFAPCVRVMAHILRRGQCHKRSAAINPEEQEMGNLRIRGGSSFRRPQISVAASWHSLLAQIPSVAHWYDRIGWRVCTLMVIPFCTTVVLVIIALNQEHGSAIPFGLLLLSAASLLAFVYPICFSWNHSKSYGRKEVSLKFLHKFKCTRPLWRLYFWWVSVFGISHGRLWSWKLHILELFEISLQLASVAQWATTEDSWKVFAIFSIIAANGFLSPLLALSPRTEISRQQAAVMDAIFDGLYFVMPFFLFSFKIDRLLQFAAMSFPVLFMMERVVSLQDYSMMLRILNKNTAFASENPGQVELISVLPKSARIPDGHMASSPSSRSGQSRSPSHPKHRPRASSSVFPGLNQEKLILRGRKSRPKWYIVVLCLLCACLSVSIWAFYLSLALQQSTDCQAQLGAEVWSRTGHPVFWSNGVLQKPSCGLQLVTALDLSGLALSVVPMALTGAKFPQLAALNLRENSLSSLPALQLLTLSKLTSLDIRHNSISFLDPGLAKEWNRLLRSFLVEGNPVAIHFDWSGQDIDSLPERLFEFSLGENMQRISLSGNPRLAVFPMSALQHATGMRDLDISHCGMSGALPKSMPSTFPRLQHLNCSFNAFNRDWSETELSVTQWRDLRSLDLSYNQFITLNPSISRLPPNTTVILHGNDLVKELHWSSSGIFELVPAVSHLSKLEVLVVDNNQLSRFSSSPLKFPSLRKLSIIQNLITHLPAWLAEELGGSLEELYLKDNFLESFPENMHKFTKLRILDVPDHPKLDWTSSSSLNKVVSLQVLDMTESRMISVPAAAGNLTRLVSLTLSRCDSLISIDNQLPLTMRMLQTLNIVNSYRFARLPSTLGSWSHLTTLNVNFNRMLNELPSFIGLKNLTQLYVQSNNLTRLPDDIFGAPLLRTILASDNRLSSLPLSIAQLTNVITLDVSFNQLSSMDLVLACNISSIQAVFFSANPQITAVPSQLRTALEPVTSQPGVGPFSVTFTLGYQSPSFTVSQASAAISSFNALFSKPRCTLLHAGSVSLYPGAGGYDVRCARLSLQ